MQMAFVRYEGYVGMYIVASPAFNKKKRSRKIDERTKEKHRVA